MKGRGWNGQLIQVSTADYFVPSYSKSARYQSMFGIANLTGLSGVPSSP